MLGPPRVIACRRPLARLPVQGRRSRTLAGYRLVMSRTRGAVAVLAVIVGACSSGRGGAPIQETDAYSDAGDAAPIDAAGQPCRSDGDCGPNYACAYAIVLSCAAAGVCVQVTPCGGSGKQPTYCGCDGGGFVRRCDLPGGYSQAPVFSGAYPPCSPVDSGDASSEGDAADASAE